jgi:quinol monooxygenase YgiN
MIQAIAKSAVLAFGAVLLAGCAASSGGDCCMTPSKSVLRHVVLFKFKDGTPADQVRAIETKFAGLKSRVPGILAFEWGTDVGPEKLSQGFTHCFFVTFADLEALKTYLPHPAHQEFVSVLKPHLDKVLVLDFHSKS